MNFEMPSFAAAMPEMVLLGLICVVLVADLFVSAERRMVTWSLAVLSLVVTAAVILAAPTESATITFSGSYIADPMSDLLKLFSLLSMGLVFVYARHYLGVNGLTQGEFYTLGLFGLFGIFVM
ncbi:MAG: NADH:ubiquinone oxidoreductase subunit N, partial [Pseudomonadota bacterium]